MSRNREVSRLRSSKRRTRRTRSSPGLLLLPTLALGGERVTPLSVPRDNWCCGTIAAPIEPVVQADAHDVGLLATSIDDYARAREWTDEGPSVAAEIGEEVLGLDAPIVEEGVFKTC